MTVTIAGIPFDNNLYDRDADVLYLHVGDPATAVDWDDTVEGDGVRYSSDGSIVGLTILNAKTRFDRDGKIVLTLPEQRIEARDVGEVLAPA
ncbi:MAG: DUF2283 domain-containing protein [Gaiellaceae bacterium]